MLLLVPQTGAELYPMEAFDERQDTAELNKSKDSNNAIAPVLFPTLRSAD